MPIIDCLFCLQNIYTVYQIILAFIDHPYYFIDPLCRLQNIHTIYRYPYYFTEHPYHFAAETKKDKYWSGQSLVC